MFRLSIQKVSKPRSLQDNFEYELTDLVGIVYNVFEAVDVITLIKGGMYDDLSLSVGEALKKRSPVLPSCLELHLHLRKEHINGAIGLSGHLHLLNQRRSGYHL